MTWRETDDGAGHVTVHLHTPSHNASALLLSPVRGAPDDTRHDYKFEPTKCDMKKGMWVIAHQQQEQLPYYGVINPTAPTAPATQDTGWNLPSFGPFYYSHGSIVTVQPNEPDGGVRHSGRAYVPPT